MKAKENMVDAYGAMDTELSERLLAEKIMLSPSPDANLVKRILTHVAINDKSPSEVRSATCISIEGTLKVYEFLKLR